MTILVTGGAGYTGGHMNLALADAGERFVVLDDMSNGVPFAVPSGVEPLDPVEVVADAALIRKTRGWQSKFDDLETIVRHAFAWEIKLQERRARSADVAPAVQHRAPAR